MAQSPFAGHVTPYAHGPGFSVVRTVFFPVFHFINHFTYKNNVIYVLNNIKIVESTQFYNNNVLTIIFFRDIENRFNQ